MFYELENIFFLEKNVTENPKELISTQFLTIWFLNQILYSINIFTAITYFTF